MSQEIYTYDPVEIFGSILPEIVTDSVNIKAVTTLAHLELFSLDANGEAVPFIAGKPHGILQHEGGVTGGETDVGCYTAGNFFSTAVTVPASANTDDKIKALFSGTPFKITFTGLGG